jgi:hypothetical protein
MEATYNVFLSTFLLVFAIIVLVVQYSGSFFSGMGQFFTMVGQFARALYLA